VDGGGGAGFVVNGGVSRGAEGDSLDADGADAMAAAVTDEVCDDGDEDEDDKNDEIDEEEVEVVVVPAAVPTPFAVCAEGGLEGGWKKEATELAPAFPPYHGDYGNRVTIVVLQSDDYSFTE
jgi:hypothetical protein